MENRTIRGDRGLGRRLLAAGAVLFALLPAAVVAQLVRSPARETQPKSAIVSYEERGSPNILYQQESGGLTTAVTRPVTADGEELPPAAPPAARPPASERAKAASAAQPVTRGAASRRGVVADATAAKK